MLSICFPKVAFISTASGDLPKKILLWFMSEDILPVFSSRIFMSYFNCLSHFKYIFVYGMRRCFNFVDLHAAIQLSQHHLLKRPFLHCIFLPPWLKKKMTVGVWVYFWTLYFVPLIQMSVFVPLHIVLITVTLWYWLESGRVIPPALFFFLKIPMVILGLFWFHINFRIICSSSMKNCHG